MKNILLVFLIFSLEGFSQNKKHASANSQSEKKDTVVAKDFRADTLDAKEVEITENRTFGVYTRKPRKSDKRMKLCINLVSEQSVLNLCINDSICKFPEQSEILFEKKNGDSTYVLVYVDAVTKVDDKPECDAGHETKLFFIRWNTRNNKASYKQRTVSSCMKAVTNMTHDPITNWDKVSPLHVKYHKGNEVFVELTFDPNEYLKGFQSNTE